MVLKTVVIEVFTEATGSLMALAGRVSELAEAP